MSGFVNRLLVLISLIAISLSQISLASPPSNGRGITPEDYFAFEFLSDPQLSPDGKLVSYVVTTVDQKQNRRYSSVWMAAADGSRSPWQFTTSPQSSTSPRWSSDGQYLAFLSSRPSMGAPSAGESPRNQVYLLSMKGGEAKRLTSLKNGVASFEWSPDGSRLACISRVGPGDSRSDSADRSDVRHYSHISYKFNDTGWFDDRRSHIWVVDIKSGTAKQITSGDDWNDTAPSWSPDGTRIAFVSDRSGRAFDDSRNTDVWTIPAEGGELTRISDHEESDREPRWSPDGKTIAFVGNIKESSHPKIWTVASTGGAASTVAAKDLDLIPSQIEWAEEGRAIYFEAGVKGENHVFRVGAASGVITAITSGPRAVRNFDVNDKAGKMVYAVNDFKHLDDLYACDLSGKNERKLTSLNLGIFQQLHMQDVERIVYKGADGWDIDGFFVRPLGWQEGKKYPMILSIHGGPAGMYGVDWFHEFQVYAAKGWAVFFANPRGSTGYGEKFERGIEGEWGGKDYVDVMKGVDAILAKYSWLDRDRLGVTGGSYGGYLTNWILGHTDMFKAAVTVRSVVNFISDEGTRDGAYGHKRDFGGDLFEKFDMYWDRSPLKYARNVKTPTLILHSDNDFRVPLEQGEQWFRALKHFGVTAEMVIFPRENHNLTRTGEPKHLVESLNWQVYWFDKFLNGNTAAIPPDMK